MDRQTMHCTEGRNRRVNQAASAILIKTYSNTILLEYDSRQVLSVNRQYGDIVDQ